MDLKNLPSELAASVLDFCKENVQYQDRLSLHGTITILVDDKTVVSFFSNRVQSSEGSGNGDLPRQLVTCDERTVNCLSGAGSMGEEIVNTPRDSQASRPPDRKQSSSVTENTTNSNTINTVARSARVTHSPASQRRPPSNAAAGRPPSAQDLDDSITFVAVKQEPKDEDPDFPSYLTESGAGNQYDEQLDDGAMDDTTSWWHVPSGEQGIETSYQSDQNMEMRNQTGAATQGVGSLGSRNPPQMGMQDAIWTQPGQGRTVMQGTAQPMSLPWSSETINVSSVAASYPDPAVWTTTAGTTIPYTSASSTQAIPSTSSSDPNLVLECNICRLILPSYLELQSHIKLCHPKSFTCNICGKQFSKSLSLTEHMRVHTGSGVAGTSTIPSSSVGSLGTNVPSVSSLGMPPGDGGGGGEKPYQCQVCSKTFRQASTFLVHQYTHTKKKTHREAERNPPLPLDGAEIGSELASSWQLAPPTVAPPTMAPPVPTLPAGRQGRAKFLTEKHHCVKCTKIFMSRKGLIKHMQKIHAKRFTYVCPHCEKGFVEKAQFQAHMNKHRGVRPFKCQTCTKSFRSEATMKKHAKLCVLKTAKVSG